LEFVVDPYRFPTLRRAGIALLRAEASAGYWLRNLRRIDGWTVAVCVVALLALVIQTWATAIALGCLLLLRVAMWAAEHRRYELVDIAETDSLSGYELEDWTQRFLELLGFSVERTPYRRDYGADLIATWNGIRTAVQVKSGHTNVGVAAVQQVVAAKRFYDCERAMVVTNQYFTAQALILAEANGVVMRGRDDLVRGLLRTRRSETGAVALS
jgi:HJR/Mrr/RecB family endonuclease